MRSQTKRMCGSQPYRHSCLGTISHPQNVIIAQETYRKGQFMLQNLCRPVSCKLRLSTSKPRHVHTAQKAFEPLRILFCGSEEFSIASLKALHNEYLKNARNVASIDVVCRPGKPVGRGLKTIQEGIVLQYLLQATSLRVCSSNRTRRRDSRSTIASD